LDHGVDYVQLDHARLPLPRQKRKLMLDSGLRVVKRPNALAPPKGIFYNPAAREILRTALLDIFLSQVR
jgi:hypothetical protein